jgi:hypothetical protein
MSPKRRSTRRPSPVARRTSFPARTGGGVVAVGEHDGVDHADLVPTSVTAFPITR